VPTAELGERNRIWLETEWRDRDLVKMVPGTTWDRDSRMWSLPLSWANCLVLRGVFGSDLEIGPVLEDWAWAELNERIQPALAARSLAMDPDSPGVVGYEGPLYGYQQHGVEFLVAAESAILADEMGAGKTVQTIMALSRFMALEDRPVLIVCPNSVKSVWASEFAKWYPEADVCVVHGSAARRRKLLDEDHDVFIVNYEALRSHSRLAPYGSIRLSEKEKEPGQLNRPWVAVVADEAHRAKDPKAKQTRALWACAAEAEHRYALTGTPVANNPGDFWSLLRFVSPSEWPSRTKFVDRFCLTAWNAFGGVDIIGLNPHTRDEFFQVADPRFLRRTKAMVLPHLPPKVRITRTVDLAPKQKKVYRALRDDMVAQLDSGVVSAFDSLTLLGRLSQAASAYLEVDDEGGVSLTDPSSKLDALEDILEETDDPVVVFAASKKLVNLASARLEKREVAHAVITGDVLPEDRARAVDAFQAGRLKAIILTLGAGAEGLTLTAAPTLVFLQRSWSLVESRQAEDRIHRPGAEKWESVTIIDIVAADTVEEDQAVALAGKGDMLEQITGDTEALKGVLCGG
jgi:SNF2 family DNA or RNA helicase